MKGKIATNMKPLTGATTFVYSQRDEPSIVSPCPLNFTPFAWMKMVCMIQECDTEVAGFGLLDPEDLCSITDIKIIKQAASCSSVDFDTAALAAWRFEYMGEGHKPEHMERVWIHTHPGFSPSPSSIDYGTFDDACELNDWMCMVIVDNHYKTYGQICYQSGPKIELRLNVGVDWTAINYNIDLPAWHKFWIAEISSLVSKAAPAYTTTRQAWDNQYKNAKNNPRNQVTELSHGCVEGYDWQDTAYPARLSDE